jgi:hypothetical protein
MWHLTTGILNLRHWICLTSCTDCQSGKTTQTFGSYSSSDCKGQYKTRDRYWFHNECQMCITRYSIIVSSIGIDFY